MSPRPSPVLLTGPTRGLGRALAQSLAGRGHPLVLLARDPVAGAALVAELGSLPGNAGARLVLADLLDPAAIDRAAAEIAGLGPIGAVLHNAGLWPTELQVDGRGIERSFAVNHLASFQLGARLWPQLRAWGARVVHVSAGLYALGRPGPEQAATGARFSSWRTYCDTKRCNAVFTAALARRTSGQGVAVNAVHPGVLATGLGEGDGGLWAGLVRPLKRLWRAPETGVDGPLWLATAPEVEGLSGQYFDERQPEPWRNGVEDPAEAEALWALSERLCGLRFAP